MYLHVNAHLVSRHLIFPLVFDFSFGCSFNSCLYKPALYLYFFLQIVQLMERMFEPECFLMQTPFFNKLTGCRGNLLWRCGFVGRNLIWGCYCERLGGNLLWGCYCEMLGGNLLWGCYCVRFGGNLLWGRDCVRFGGNLLWQHDCMSLGGNLLREHACVRLGGNLIC